MSAGIVFGLALVVFIIAAGCVLLERAAWEDPTPSPMLDEGPPVAQYAAVASLFVMFLCVLWWVYQWLAWLQEMVTP